MSLSAGYSDTLDQLSDASVRTHFEAFVDIPWDEPEFAIDVTDPRWKLPTTDPLGRHQWYLTLPDADQIRIGLLRQANIAKTGVHVESLLMRGLLQYSVSIPNGSPEFRFCTHEVTEETHHSQMFQEFVNRAGVDVPGAPWWLRGLGHLFPNTTLFFPELFFLGVLVGEEPLDHVQKMVLRSGAELHPLMERILQIHVAEEARHISFAHEFLRERVPHLDPIRRAAISIAFPVLSRMLAEVVAVPSREFIRAAGIPKHVVDEVFWTTADSKEMLSEMFGDVRMLVEELGLMNRLTRPIWKFFGVSGRPSRFRGETHQFSAVS